MSDVSENLVDDITSNEPNVREEIVTAIEEKQAEQVPNDSPSVNGYIPPTSEAFNPAIHEVDDKGNPRLTKDGKFRRKRGQRPKNSKPNTAPASESNPFAGESNPFAGPEFDYAATATFITSLVFSAMESAFGPSWKPNDGERNNINNATARFCEAHSIADLPPGIALTLAFGLYALPRFNDPETLERMRSYGESLGLVNPKKKVTNEAGYYDEGP